jgi:hypothetical protein
MRYHSRVGLKLVAGALALALTLVACGEPTPPTRGSIQTQGGDPDTGQLTLAASTNCAMLGETITFTLRIKNIATTSLAFTHPPLFDMTISQVNGPKVRWSDSAQYPSAMNPILAPGEVREYQWHWVADREGALTLEVRTAALPAGDTTPNQHDASLIFGVNWMQWSPGSIPGRISCTDLKQ